MKRSLWWMRGPLREAAGADGADGGSGDPKTPDPEMVKAIAGAVAALVMPEVNKTLNGYDTKLNKRLDGLKPKPEDKPDDKPADDKPADDKNKPDAKTQLLERQIADLRKEREQERATAEAKEAKVKERSRQADLTKALSELGVPKERLESAIRALGPDVQFDEEGKGENLVGPDGTSLGEYAKVWIKLNEHFLPPVPVGGAGAQPGQQRGAKAVDINSIKPGMKPEEVNAAWDDIGKALQG